MNESEMRTLLEIHRIQDELLRIIKKLQFTLIFLDDPDTKIAAENFIYTWNRINKTTGKLLEGAEEESISE